jgi:hypothetical protein
MVSPVDIGNMALSIVGSNTTIVSISPPDGTAAAQHVATFYDITRREALGNGYAWSFAKRRAALAELSVNPSTVWSYAYALPAGCLKPIRVLALGTLDQVDWATVRGWRMLTEAGGADFAIETDGTQKVLLTNEPNAVLLYLVDQVDTTFWSTGFVSAMATLLASWISGPIIRGAAGAKTKATLRKEAMGLLDLAAAADANASSSERADHTSETLLARA